MVLCDRQSSSSSAGRHKSRTRLSSTTVARAIMAAPEYAIGWRAPVAERRTAELDYPVAVTASGRTLHPVIGGPARRIGPSVRRSSHLKRHG
jgi:hypothetical protein